jgi:hypothetical protein
VLLSWRVVMQICLSVACLFWARLSCPNTPRQSWRGHDKAFTLHLHLSHLADALIQSDLQIGAFTLWHPVEQSLYNSSSKS